MSFRACTCQTSHQMTTRQIAQLVDTYCSRCSYLPDDSAMIRFTWRDLEAFPAQTCEHDINKSDPMR